MSEGDLRFAFVTSTAGSVMNEVLKNEFVRTRTHLVVADREGAGAEKARAHGVTTVTLSGSGVEDFCAALLQLLETYAIDVVFSFYVQFYAAPLRTAFADRIVNFHPSLLPAFKGADGFGDTVAYPARLAGNTVEFIADTMDEGKIIMQTVCPIDESMAIEHTRHRVFQQQCQALIQVARWLQDHRVRTEGRRVIVEGARFDSPSFSPALDAPDAITWVPPNPYAAGAKRGPPG